MEIKVSEDSFYIDGELKEVADLTQGFLERLVEDSLNDEVIYEIEGETPIAKFFKVLNEGTKEGSELRRLKESAEEKAKKAIKIGEQYVDEHCDAPLAGGEMKSRTPTWQM